MTITTMTTGDVTVGAASTQIVATGAEAEDTAGIITVLQDREGAETAVGIVTPTSLKASMRISSVMSWPAIIWR